MLTKLSLLLSMLKTAFFGFFDEKKVQMNSVYLKYNLL